MMSLRPIVVNRDGMILGGNMRYQALVALGYKEIPDTWVKVADQLNTEEERRFVIEDNVGFGDWDYDMLANEWDSTELEEWGLDVWQNKDDKKKKEIHYLCEAGSTLHVTELARMMGCALEDPDGNIKKELEDRLRALKEQGVTVSEEPQEMNLQMQVYEYKDKKGERKFGIWCGDCDRMTHDLLFCINDFDDAPTAKHWGKVYADFFRKHGVQVNVKMKKNS